VEFQFGFVVSDQPVEYYMQFARNNGLSHLEIDLAKEHSQLTSFDAKRVANLKKLCSQYPVSLSVHAPYKLNLADRSGGVMDFLAGTIELAKNLEARFITVYPGSFARQKEPAAARKRALNSALKSLGEAAELCASRKLKLAIENTNRMPKDSEIFYLGDNLKDLAQIFREIDSPVLKLCLDLGHAHLNEGILKYIDRFRERIISVHFHDNDGKSDDHLDVGEGSINWKQTLKALAKIKFYGPLLSETRESPAQSKRKLLEYL